ncbi:TPA: flagellin, partial [Campylobacter lari]|nr:flagellin [Campylobacter lari]
MGFRINTNIGAMNAHANSTITARELDKSLARLSSGLRINSAADDASGMAIADSLRSQAATLGQAINNGNDAIGILQTADKAMDEQLKILDTIKVKAT